MAFFAWTNDTKSYMMPLGILLISELLLNAKESHGHKYICHDTTNE